MAEKTQFILGTIGADFEQMKTSDNIYLKDLLRNGLDDSLELYNSRTLAITKLFAKQYSQSSSTAKKTYSSDSFVEIGEIETPGTRTTFDVWNHPVPIRRLAAATMMTTEQIKKMDSAQFLAFHNAKLLADQSSITTNLYKAACLKTPTDRVDALDGNAIKAKAFWNDETGMDTPRPNGQITFDGDHQHYLAFNPAGIGTQGANITTAIATVTEHLGMGGAEIIVAARRGANVNLIKALTAFKSVVGQSSLIGMINPAYQQSGFQQALLEGGLQLGHNMKAVGTWNDALICETPDLPTNYIMVMAFNGQNSDNAPIAWRQHPQFSGLVIESPSGANPIIGIDAQYRRYLGLGVNNRSAGAIMYLGGTSWVEPTFISGN